MKEKTTQEVLELLLHRLKIDKTNPVSKIHQLWGEIVGEDLLLNAQLYDLKRGVLVIKVTHPTYASMVMLRRKAILERLKERFPELKITQIQVRSGI